MKRLTQTSDKGGVAFTFDLTISCEPNEAKKILKVAEKLKQYEDLEEQGRLLRLPCKVGDTVYVIHYIDRRYVICSHVISKFVIMPYRFPRVQIYFEKENGFITSDFEGQVNENLFLTREEAEAKLAEMEESHD
jgi:hypothetical protein